MPSLNYCKGQVAGTVLNGCIYVIGGSDDLLREGLKTVEKYNPFTNKWEAVSPMRVGRGALGKRWVSRLCFLEQSKCYRTIFLHFRHIKWSVVFDQTH